MKTQISSLINGSKNVRRDLNNNKYKNAKKSTSHIGYAGSNHVERITIGQQVLIENATEMIISVFGETILLNRVNSLSGKTSSYIADLSENQFIKLSGYSSNPITNYQSKFSLTINEDMTVAINIFARKTEGSQWKQRMYLYIDESFITIL